MRFIDSQLVEFKKLFENAIEAEGSIGKTSLIRSSKIIELIHDAVKYELQEKGVNPKMIYPRLGESKPEINVTGFLKQKKQDITVLPINIETKQEKVDWGPLKYENIIDPYGREYVENMLIINVRSQMSSVAKNADTLFERTFAESLNLHLLYPKVVLGEVYLIPAYEYDDELVKIKEVGFKKNPVNIEKYVSFFTAMNLRDIKEDSNNDDYKYERVALLIVDFNKEVPKLYKTTSELKEDSLVSADFELEYENLNFENFAEDILNIYSERYDIDNIVF